jgi:hypothetical protein
MRKEFFKKLILSNIKFLGRCFFNLLDRKLTSRKRFMIYAMLNAYWVFFMLLFCRDKVSEQQKMLYPFLFIHGSLEIK